MKYIFLLKKKQRKIMNLKSIKTLNDKGNISLIFVIIFNMIFLIFAFSFINLEFNKKIINNYYILKKEEYLTKSLTDYSYNLLYEKILSINKDFLEYINNLEEEKEKIAEPKDCIDLNKEYRIFLKSKEKDIKKTLKDSEYKIYLEKQNISILKENLDINIICEYKRKHKYKIILTIFDENIKLKNFEEEKNILTKGYLIKLK
ncbi:MAG: hypothetical protein N4A54_09665 [Peptostreptococcaceae bacterium]|nr:hypothetical protein [Peptostreptococcaceae bacterium]